MKLQSMIMAGIVATYAIASYNIPVTIASSIIAGVYICLWESE